MIIETDRLRLRHFRESDADAVHVYASDPEVCKYTDFGPNTWDETVEYIESATSHPKSSFADLAITLRHHDVVVGGCGAFVPKGEHPDDRPHVREMGWVLRQDLWGQGIATEAATALIARLRREPHITRLEARCRPHNKASERIMQKLGMSFEFLLERDYQIRGAWVDSHLYSLALKTYK